MSDNQTITPPTAAAAAEPAAPAQPSTLLSTPPAEPAAPAAGTPPAAAAAPAVGDKKDSGGTPPPDATKEPAKPPVVPEKYDLKLPQGSLLPTARLEEIATLAKSQGFSNEQAQTLVERESNAVATYIDSQKAGSDAWKSRVGEWENQAVSDKEIGGSRENLQASAEHARRALSEFFPGSVSKMLDESGLGSHPDVIRGFFRIGKLMANDKMVTPGRQEGGQKKSIEQVFYPENKS